MTTRILPLIHHWPIQIPAETVAAIKRDRAREDRVRVIAERHGVSIGYVSRVCRGEMRREVVV